MKPILSESYQSCADFPENITEWVTILMSAKGTSNKQLLWFNWRVNVILLSLAASLEYDAGGMT